MSLVEAFGGVEEVDGHGINETEVPGGLVFGWRFQLGDSEAGIRMPGHIAYVVGAQVLEVSESGIVDGRAAAKKRDDDDLQGRCSFEGLKLGGPVDGDLDGRVGGLLSCRDAAAECETTCCGEEGPDHFEGSHSA